MISLLKISVSLIIICSSLNVTAGDPYRSSAGAGEAGIGYVCIMRNTFWSSFHNQAALSNNNSFALGVNYENRFNLKELGTRTAGLIIPAGKASLGAVYSYFGYPDFRRMMAGLACGLRLSSHLAAGVQVDYISENTTGEYNHYQFITCETGMMISPTENIKIGIHIFNPVPNSVRKTAVPSIIRIGIGTDLNSSIFTGIEAEMSTGRKLIFRTGFEYEALKKTWLRGGFSTDNNSFAFGIGFLAKIVKIDLGFTTHEKLGITTSASLIFKLKTVE